MNLLRGQIPVDAHFVDVQALYEEAGWQLDRVRGSHHIFTKDDLRPDVVAVHGKMVKIEALKKLAQALQKATNED